MELSPHAACRTFVIRGREAVAAWMGRLRLSAPSWLVIWAFFVLAIGAALRMPFPSEVDEIQHLSVVRAQYERPEIFPDWSQYRVLRQDDLERWSNKDNYINHPALYYIALAPVMGVTHNPVVYRVIDALIATIALLLVVIAGQRLAGSEVPGGLIACLAAGFPKAVAIAGMVNNDDLAALAGALFFAGIAGLSGAPCWIAAGLALAGWSKLTAFVALGSVATARIGLLAMHGRRKPAGQSVLAATVGLALGALPYLVTLARTGHLLWINVNHWRVPLALRAHLDFADFARWFAGMFLMKWPAIEQPYPLGIVLLGFLMPLGLAVAAAVYKPAIRAECAAYLIGFLVLFGIQFGFAWHSFQALGDLTNTQTRYYNVLWPGIAVGSSAIVAKLSAHCRPLGLLLVAICLLPTVLGSALYGVLTHLG